MAETIGTKAIEANATFAVSSDLEISQVPDGAMIFQASRDRVHYLNPTAAIILELCDLGKSRAEIEAFMIEGFALTAPIADEVEKCLNDLLLEGLITPA
ncbi:MAG: PqqD family protein [Mesorhizobium sp.]|nr:PqqD family protein [Mesorhizobium sp.]MBL8579976.1 PqqD family protein [Mesorhizobium sp.]